MKSNSPSVIAICTDGVEEMELISITEILRRVGIPVQIVSWKKDKNIKGLNDISLLADKTLDDVKNMEPDCIIIPGGKVESLANSHELIEMIRKQIKNNKLVVASGTTPLMILEKNGLLEGIEATCDPKISSQLKNKNRCQDRVVVCKNIITSQGPGTAINLALTVCEKLIPSEVPRIQKLVNELCIDPSCLKNIPSLMEKTSGSMGMAGHSAEGSLV